MSTYNYINIFNISLNYELMHTVNSEKCEVSKPSTVRKRYARHGDTSGYFEARFVFVERKGGMKMKTKSTTLLNRSVKNVGTLFKK